MTDVLSSIVDRPDGPGAMDPIPQEWIRDYVDQLLAVAQRLGPGVMQDAALQRADHVMEMVRAFGKRNTPL